jgi:ubiquinone biosynthesis protein UbiJ
MFDDLRSLAGGAVMARATLLANHVIGAEPAAMARLKPHAGRSFALVLEGWPALLPPPPPLAFVVTPAGLLEWCGPDAPAEPDLRVALDAANPLLLASRVLTGERGRIEVSGDGALAADIQWLIDNLRWDVQDDLERVVGPAAAHELARLASLAAPALREAARRFAATFPSGGRGDAR